MKSFRRFLSEAKKVSPFKTAKDKVMSDPEYLASEQHADAMLRLAFDEQTKYIKKNFGKRAADRANYGWGIGGDQHHTSVATKVYGHGVLQTDVDHKTRKIDHDFE